MDELISYGYGWRWHGARLWTDHLEVDTVSIRQEVYVDKANKNGEERWEYL